MRIFHRSKIYLLKSVIRAYLLKIINFRKIKLSYLVLVGKNSAFFSKNEGKIVVGRKSFFFDYVEIQSRGFLKIGSNVQVNNYSRIIALEEINIGNNVTIAQFVSILDHDHQYKINNSGLYLEGYKTAPINIGDNVWISDKVTILKGVNIGDNVIIGANSLVNKDVPSKSVVGGVPSRVLKKLSNH